MASTLLAALVVAAGLDVVFAVLDKPLVGSEFDVVVLVAPSADVLETSIGCIGVPATPFPLPPPPSYVLRPHLHRQDALAKTREGCKSFFLPSVISCV